MSAVPTSEFVSVERDGRVALVWLDREDERNAMAPAFWTEFPAIIAVLSADADVRVIVIAARGPAFTVGLDLKAFGPALLAGGLDPEEEPSSPVAARLAGYETIRAMQRTFSSLAESAKPVIAAVHGFCLGAGIDLITACDIRYAAADSVFSIRETKLAMVADVGTLQRLPAIVDPGRAAEVVYTGRDFGAAEALEMRLVSRVLPDREAVVKHALDVAADIAANSPLAVQGAKHVMSRADGMTVEQQLDYVALWNAAFLNSSDLTEAIASFVERRPPEFTGH